MQQGKGKTIIVRAIKGLILAALVLLMPLTNLLVDPAGLFRSEIDGSVEAQAVDIMMSGLSAEGLDNYDERLVKRLCLYEKGEVDTLVLSSSRGALVTAEMAGEDSFFNLAVTGAGLRDVIGMYGVYCMQGYSVDRVILVLDPCFFNNAYDSLRFEGVLTDGYRYCLETVMGYPADSVDYDDSVRALYLGETDGAPSLFSQPLKTQAELFSIPYFQSSLQLLLKGTASVTLSSSERMWTLGASLRPDGSYCYPRDYREQPLEEVVELAESQLIEDGNGTARIIGAENMDVNDELRRLFCDLLKGLAAQGVQVDVLIPPLNPVLWDYMQQHERYVPVFSLSDWVREQAAMYGFEVLGDFDPHTLGYAAKDFYDGYHLRAESVAELMAGFGGAQ